MSETLSDRSTDSAGCRRRLGQVEPNVKPDGRRGAEPVRNVMSIDVEDVDAMNFESMAKCRSQTPESRVRANMNVLFDVLAQHHAKATMFFLGTVAERFPDLVRRAQAEGHEIASHGYGHEMVSRQTAEEFRADVARSVDILRQITGQSVLGYRAPSWSISKETPWAYEILADLGFHYDASVFPFTTYLYGDGEAPTRPFTPPGGPTQAVRSAGQRCDAFRKTHPLRRRLLPPRHALDDHPSGHLLGQPFRAACHILPASARDRPEAAAIRPALA